MLTIELRGLEMSVTHLPVRDTPARLLGVCRRWSRLTRRHVAVLANIMACFTNGQLRGTLYSCGYTENDHTRLQMLLR